MRLQLVVVLLFTWFAGACADSYVTPGAAADFAKLGLTPEAKAAMTDKSVQAILDKKPLVTFPASIAIAHVQAGDYYNFAMTRGYQPSPLAQTGAYSVITQREVEKDEDFDAIAKLPQVAGVGTMKRILLDKGLNSDLELRTAAAKLHANLLLYYTFDTRFHTDETAAPLTPLSLGLIPNQHAKVTSTVSAVLMDVNNGYVYAVVEATAKNDQLANAWNSDETLDKVRQATERQAFEDLVKQFKSEWTNVVMTYNRPAPAAAAK